MLKEPCIVPASPKGYINPLSRVYKGFWQSHPTRVRLLADPYVAARMAAPYKSEDTQLAVGTESTQGTSVAPTRVFGEVAEAASPPDPEIDWRPHRVIGGDRTIFDKTEGQHQYQGGEVPTILQDGAPLAYLLGAETVATDTDIDGGSKTGTDTHTLTPKTDGLPPTQTIEAVYYGRGGGTDFVRTFAGCAPNEGEITTNNDDELVANLTYWAMSVTPGTSPTGSISVPSYGPWIFADAASQLSLFSTTFARFVSFSLSIENNLEEGRYIVDDANHPSNTRDPYELTYGNFDATLDATIAIEDDAIYQELVSPTDGGFSAVIEFERANGDTLKITGEGANFESAPHDLPEDSQTIEVETSMSLEGLTIEVEDSNISGAYL